MGNSRVFGRVEGPALADLDGHPGLAGECRGRQNNAVGMEVTKRRRLERLTVRRMNVHDQVRLEQAREFDCNPPSRASPCSVRFGGPGERTEPSRAAFHPNAFAAAKPVLGSTLL